MRQLAAGSHIFCVSCAVFAIIAAAWLWCAKSLSPEKQWLAARCYSEGKASGHVLVISVVISGINRIPDSAFRVA